MKLSCSICRRRIVHPILVAKSVNGGTTRSLSTDQIVNLLQNNRRLALRRTSANLGGGGGNHTGHLEDQRPEMLLRDITAVEQIPYRLQRKKNCLCQGETLDLSLYGI